MAFAADNGPFVHRLAGLPGKVFLLDPAIEKELIAGRYLAYSTRSADQHVKAMDVDYAQVAREMRKAVEIALTILQNR